MFSKSLHRVPSPGPSSTNKILSGLYRSKKLLGHLKEISVVDFDHTDVVRHPLVSKIVKAYSDKKLNND